MATKLEDGAASSQPAPDTIERRGHQRVRCQGEVELRRIPPAPPEAIFGKIKNISAGGCFLETERPLELGHRFVMEMKLEALQLRLIAEVRSVKTDPSCWAGLEFVGISVEGLEKLKALIEVVAKEQSRPTEPAAKQ